MTLVKIASTSAALTEPLSLGFLASSVNEVRSDIFSSVSSIDFLGFVNDGGVRAEPCCSSGFSRNCAWRFRSCA